MPHIILKRSDIPRGALQVLDLKPNTSQRQVIDPPGQTRYIVPPVNQTVVLKGAAPILTHVQSEGLASWFITNVNDGTGVAASGAFTIAAGDVTPGTTATVDATALGGPSILFTFIGGAPATPQDVEVGANENITAANFAAAINNPANGLAPYLVAAAPGGGPPSAINITAVAEGTAGNGIAISNAVDPNLSVSGATLAGGVDADSLTAAEANTIASTILSDLVRFGDLTQPAVAADLAAINGIVAASVATASITAAQLREVLDILEGRTYLLPKNVQINSTGTVFDVQPAVGTPTGPRFVEPSIRHTYDTGSLKISVGEGHLNGFLNSAFTYKNLAGNPNGEAVVVYDDDGSIYIP